MPPRFFAPDARTTGELVALPPDESEHLTRVLRLGAGAQIRVFDGRGHEFDAVVEGSLKDSVQVRLGATCTSAPEPRLTVTLAQAVLKGDKTDDVVRDAVMIGVAAIRPVIATRTEIAASALEKGHRRERWERIAIASAKQCGRAVVPTVHEPVSVEALTQTLLGQWLDGPALLLVEPRRFNTAVAFGELDVEIPKAATVVVGPEGGWTAAEIEAASSVCRLVTMGERTVRADAMGLVAVAALFARWKEF